MIDFIQRFVENCPHVNSNEHYNFYTKFRLSKDVSAILCDQNCLKHKMITSLVKLPFLEWHKRIKKVKIISLANLKIF